MISYRLKCKHDHAFDSWFKSSEDFEKLRKAGLVECAICGSTEVEKSLMAPNTSVKRENKAPHPPNPMEQYRKQVKEHLKDAKNVGWQFAKEARAIHYGDKEAKPIYGKTEPEEAKALVDEGVRILPMPFDPEAKEN